MPYTSSAVTSLSSNRSHCHGNGHLDNGSESLRSIPIASCVILNPIKYIAGRVQVLLNAIKYVAGTPQGHLSSKYGLIHAYVVKKLQECGMIG